MPGLQSCSICFTMTCLVYNRIVASVIYILLLVVQLNVFKVEE